MPVQAAPLLEFYRFKAVRLMSFKLAPVEVAVPVAVPARWVELGVVCLAYL
jgi:hypothetical protein